MRLQTILYGRGSHAKKLIITCLGISFGMTLGLLFINIKDLRIKGNASK